MQTDGSLHSLNKSAQLMGIIYHHRDHHGSRIQYSSHGKAVEFVWLPCVDKLKLIKLSNSLILTAEPVTNKVYRHTYITDCFKSDVYSAIKH